MLTPLEQTILEEYRKSDGYTKELVHRVLKIYEAVKSINTKDKA